jgi:predicted amidophosphoribosyltransferase
VGRRHLPEWKYKEVAINRISELLIETVPSFLKNKDTTFVPIPPSKTKCNPEYDDRLIQVLFKYKQKYSDANLKELLFIKQDVIAVHTSSRKRDVNALFQNLGIDKKACADITKNVVLFDDVITTGAHFKACKRAIEHIPGVERVIGIFVARRSVMATIQYEFKDLFGSDR